MSEVIIKALVPTSADYHQLETLHTEVDFRTVVKPLLLSAIFNPKTNYELTNSFTYDTRARTYQLPETKQYTETGPAVTFDTQNQKSFIISSAGLQGSFTPQDMANQRQAGSLTFKDQVYYQSMIADKLDTAWDLDLELSFAQILSDDTNRLTNTKGTSYNYFTTIEGVTRKAYFDAVTSGTAYSTNGSGKFDIVFATQADVAAYMNDMKDILYAEAAKAGISGGMVVAICGTNWFNKRLKAEKQEGLARSLRSAKDFVSEVVPQVNYGGINYNTFTGAADDITYIKYGAGILSATDLIGADDCKLTLVGGTSNFSINYAPAMRMSTINQRALPMYRWGTMDEVAGFRQLTESNRLVLLEKPSTVIHLTSST